MPKAFRSPKEFGQLSEVRVSNRLPARISIQEGRGMDLESGAMTDGVFTDLVEAIASRVAARVRAELSELTRQRVLPALLSVKQAAVYIGRSEQAVQHLIFQRDLPVVRVGRRVHLDRRDLDGWIENNKY